MWGVLLSRYERFVPHAIARHIYVGFLNEVRPAPPRRSAVQSALRHQAPCSQWTVPDTRRRAPAERMLPPAMQQSIRQIAFPEFLRRRCVRPSRHFHRSPTEFGKALGLSHDGPVKPHVIRLDKASCQHPSQLVQLDFRRSFGLLVQSTGKKLTHLSAHRTSLCVEGGQLLKLVCVSFLRGDHLDEAPPNGRQTAHDAVMDLPDAFQV